MSDSYYSNDSLTVYYSTSSSAEWAREYNPNKFYYVIEERADVTRRKEGVKICKVIHEF